MAVSGHAAAEQQPEEPGHRRPSATRSDKLARLQALLLEEHGAKRGALLGYAKLMAMKFRGKVNDRDDEELLQEAIVRALDDTREWYPQETDFLTFLKGCIRSIASSWYRGAKNRESADTVVSRINQYEETEASITINKARDCLRSHRYAVEIFDLMVNDGCKGPEIRRRLGIAKDVYEAAYRWMYRKLEREGYR